LRRGQPNFKLAKLPSSNGIAGLWVEVADELRTVILVVPSAIMPIERNYLVNPANTDAARIRVVQELPFSFDLRMLKR
jgi:RES domain-containing protein